MTGIRGIGEVGVFGSKPLRNRLKRGGGVIKGLKGLTVGLEVLQKSLRGVMGVFRGVRGVEWRIF